VTLTEPGGWRALSELQALPGVLRAEPYRIVPVRLRHGQRSHSGVIRGLEPGGDLVRVLDADLRPEPGVAERAQEIRNFSRVMRETMLFFTYVATAFSLVIAFGVIYNSARIALTERGRELASLRVLGFTRPEIAYVLLGELALLTLLAIPFGMLFARWMCYYIAPAMQNDLFRVPAVLVPQTYAIAAAVVLVSSALSGIAVRARLDKLDLIAVLKTAE